jgi:hypothetical protein
MRENHQSSHIEVLKSHENNNHQTKKNKQKERKLMRERHVVVVAYVGSRRELDGPRRWGEMML